ncbi:M24 family metallopeptidase [Paenibacillus sp. y28]|uniref:M24 family metallopeptidase n=1 Tax=Paenibacillus sp. y28 TaxID=3129110 RepID=UPI00301AAD0A
MIAERLKRLRTALAEQGLPALLISNPYNRKYITGFTGSSGYVLVTDRDAILFTDFRYREQAPKQAPLYRIVEHEPRAMLSVRQVLQELGISELGFEQNGVTYGAFLSFAEDLKGIQLLPTDSIVEKLRMIKDAAELKIMQEAVELADRAFTHILGYIKPGAKERDIALELEFFLRKNGAAGTSFDTIVASGERSALPHGVASDRVLQPNEFVKLDFGALYQGYCSDITRTVFIGKPTDRHKEIYRIVLEAQLHALANLRPGMTGREGDSLTRDIITKYGYGDCFGHGTGHSLGMQIHEAPRLSQTCDTVMEPGMTMTVEPGIYISGFGGVRIEDDIVFTETGIRILTHSSKEFLCL